MANYQKAKGTQDFYDLDALKSASQNSTWVVEAAAFSWDTTANAEQEKIVEEEKKEEATEEKNTSLYLELDWGEEIDKALYWMFNNGLTKYGTGD